MCDRSYDLKHDEEDEANNGTKGDPDRKASVQEGAGEFSS